MSEPVVTGGRRVRLPVLVGAAIFFVAFLFRLIGIGWSLKNDLHNQSYHPDELVNFGYSQNIDLASGNLTPHFYSYGTLFFTIENVTSKFVSAYFGGPDKDKQPDWDWVARCEKGMRIVVALFGSGTALLLYALMRRYVNLLGATLAGAVVAIAPAHVVHSRFATVDVIAVFFIAASAYAALQLLPAEDSEVARIGKAAWKWVVLAGLFAGLSAGVKYTGILSLFTFYAVVFIAKRPGKVVEAAVATVVAIVSFIVSTPGCLLDQEQFLKDVKYEMLHVASGHGFTFLDTPNGFVYHLSNLFLGLGAILTLCCVAGLAWAAISKQQWAWALLAFAIPYYLLIGREEVKFLRYTFPLYVALAAGFGWLVVECHRRGGWARFGVAACILGMGGLDFGGLRSAATLTTEMAQEDPRDTALRYIRSVATPATHVGLGRDMWYWSVPFSPNSDLPIPSQRLASMQSQSVPPVDYVLSPAGDPTIFDPSLITKMRPEYIVYTSIEVHDFDRLKDAKDLSKGEQSVIEGVKRFFVELQKSYTADRSFGTGGLPVEDMAYTNPEVYVWKRNAVPSKSP